MANQQETIGGRTSGGERGGVSAKSHEAAGQVKDAMVGQVEQARQRAVSAREDTAERLRRLAQEIRRTGDTLQPRDELAAKLAHTVSRSVEGAAGYVRSMEPRQMRRDAEQFARSRPALFFGGAFLAGLALGRFFRSTGEVISQESEPRLPAPRGEQHKPPPPPAPWNQPSTNEGRVS